MTPSPQDERLLRALRIAVPIALREVLDRDVAPGEIERVAEVLFSKAAAHYGVAAATTLRVK